MHPLTSRETSLWDASLGIKGCISEGGSGMHPLIPRDASQRKVSLEVKGCTGSTFVLRDSSQGGASLGTKGCYWRIPWFAGNFPLEMHPLARRLTLCIPWLQGIFPEFFFAVNLHLPARKAESVTIAIAHNSEGEVSFGEEFSSFAIVISKDRGAKVHIDAYWKLIITEMRTRNMYVQVTFFRHQSLNVVKN